MCKIYKFVVFTKSYPKELDARFEYMGGDRKELPIALVHIGYLEIFDTNLALKSMFLSIIRIV